MLDLVGPNLLNIVGNHFEILIALLHNDALNLRDLVIEYVFLVIADEFQEKLSLFVRHSGYVAHCYDFESILVVRELLNVCVVNIFPFLVGSSEFYVVKGPIFECITANG